MGDTLWFALDIGDSVSPLVIGLQVMKRPRWRTLSPQTVTAVKGCWEGVFPWFWGVGRDWARCHELLWGSADIASEVSGKGSQYPSDVSASFTPYR